MWNNYGQNIYFLFICREKEKKKQNVLQTDINILLIDICIIRKAPIIPSDDIKLVNRRLLFCFVDFPPIANNKNYRVEWKCLMTIISNLSGTSILRQWRHHTRVPTHSRKKHVLNFRLEFAPLARSTDKLVAYLCGIQREDRKRGSDNYEYLDEQQRAACCSSRRTLHQCIYPDRFRRRNY